MEKCRKLTSVHINHVDTLEKEYMELLESYGSQLQFATVHDFCHNILARTVKACTPVRFTLRPRNPAAHVSLKILKCHLEVTSINFLRTGNFHESESSWALCSYLKTVEFEGADQRFIQGFTVVPKPRLKYIRLHNLDNVGELKIIMDYLALKTGAVERFQLSYRGIDLPPLGTFANFVRKNKFLSHVDFYSICVKNLNVPVLEDMVKAFLNAPGLKDVNLYPLSFFYCAWYKESIKDICYLQRNRRICVPFSMLNI